MYKYKPIYFVYSGQVGLRIHIRGVCRFRSTTNNEEYPSIRVWCREKPIHWKANTNQNAVLSVSWENPFLLPYYLHHKDSQNLPPLPPNCNFKFQTLYWIIEVSGSIYHVSRRKGPRLVGSDTSFKATYTTR